MNIKIRNNGEFEDLVLRGLKGIDGKSAYQLAKDGGYEGTEEEWIASLEGASAYEIAQLHGYEGTEEEWIASLKGDSVPAGGTTGQILKKDSNVDFDYSWVTLETTKSVNVAVPTSSWIASSTYADYAYKATLTVNGVTATNNIIVGLLASSTAAQEEACAVASIKCKEQAENQITLYAKSKPTVALTITVIILG